MKKLLDLRFVIGVFFGIVGALILIYALIKPQNITMDSSVNLWSSVLFLVFGIFMIVVSYTNKIDD